MTKTLRVALLALVSGLLLVAVAAAGPSGPKSGDPDGPQVTPPHYTSTDRDPHYVQRDHKAVVSQGSHRSDLWTALARAYLRWQGIRLR